MHEPSGECNLKEFSNIMSGVNPLLEYSYDYLFFFYDRESEKGWGEGGGELMYVLRNSEL